MHREIIKFKRACSRIPMGSSARIINGTGIQNVSKLTLNRVLHQIAYNVKPSKQPVLEARIAYLKPVLLRRSLVKCVDCAGAPSCINLGLCLNVSGCFFYHDGKFFCRKSLSVFQLILIPSGTVNGPTRVSLTMPAQNITPSPPC